MNRENHGLVDELCRQVAERPTPPEVVDDLCAEMASQRQAIVRMVISPASSWRHKFQGRTMRLALLGTSLAVVLGFVFLSRGIRNAPQKSAQNQVADGIETIDEPSLQDAGRESEYTLVVMAHGSGVPELRNPGFEAVVDGKPDGWFFPPVCEQAGYRVDVSGDALTGDRSAHVSASEASGQGFANLMQVFVEDSLDGFRGRRIRFRAAVRTANLADATKPGLWLRVDRPSSGPSRSQIGDFDNMQDRPIRCVDWQHFEIVADVADDARSLTVGLLLSGNGDVWIDDCSLEVVSDDAPKTTIDIASQAPQARSNSATGGSLALTEEFFSPWLWLVCGVIVLLGCSQLPDSRFQLFAFRFAFAYWIWFALPSPLQLPLSRLSPSVLMWYNHATDAVVRWTAVRMLGIERTLIPPNGSGDTIFDYIRLLICSALAVAVAILWTAFDFRRRKNSPIVSDVLKSYVRWTLGIVIFGYGMAKLGNSMNQFPEPDSLHLLKRYGDSSPMNLVWTFMGASRPYTICAGLAEAMAGVLLLWRRTTTIGAIIAVGVMLHVVLLNFCYDIPVKILSAHLFFMAVFLVLHDARRLWKVLLKQEACEQSSAGPFYPHRSWIWIHRAVKGVMVMWLCVVPAWQLVHSDHLAPARPKVGPTLYGTYEVQMFFVNGKNQPLSTEHPYRWQYVSFVAPPPYDRQSRSMVAIQTLKGPPIYAAAAVSEDDQTVELVSGAATGKYSYHLESDDQVILSGDKTRIALKRIRREDFLLVNRGFRWINEYPYNR